MDITITLENKTSYTDVLNGVTEELIKSGNEIAIRDNKIKIVTCSEFCSRTSFNPKLSLGIFSNDRH